jgi:spore germination protein PF
MPSIVGPVKIDSISSAGQVNFGDVFNISPKANSKSYAGSGSFSTGDFQFHNEWISSTNTLDSDGVDETIAANN